MELALIMPIFSLENVVCLNHLLGIFNHTPENVYHGSKRYESKRFRLSVDFFTIKATKVHKQMRESR